PARGRLRAGLPRAGLRCARAALDKSGLCGDAPDREARRLARCARALHRPAWRRRPHRRRRHAIRRLRADLNALPSSNLRKPRQPGPAEPPITLSEENGVRYLHFGSEWVQGAMWVRRPWDIAVDYVAQMMGWLLFLDPPARILQLGLGAGALTRWCWRRLPDSGVDVVEASAGVIRVTRSQFALPADDARLTVHHADAARFVADAAAGGAPRRLGVIQADLYDAEARGPVCDSLSFYLD